MPNSIPGLKAGDETKDNSKASSSTEQLADNKVQSLFNCPSILSSFSFKYVTLKKALVPIAWFTLRQ